MKRVTNSGNSKNTIGLADVICRMKCCDFKANADKDTYKEFSIKLKSIKSPAGIAVLLSEMLDDEIFPNGMIINQIISILSMQHCLQFVMEFYQIACVKGLADRNTFSSTLDAIINSPKPATHTALAVLEEAKKKKMVDTITVNQVLNVIAKSPSPDTESALGIAQEAKSKEHSSVILSQHSPQMTAVELSRPTKLNTKAQPFVPQCKAAISLSSTSNSNGFFSIEPNAETKTKLKQETSWCP